MKTAAPRPVSLRELAGPVFVYKWLIVLVTVLFGGGAVIFSYVQPELYEAAVQVWAQDQSPLLRRTSDFSGESAARIKLVLTNLREVMFSRAVLQKTIERGGVAVAGATADAVTVDESATLDDRVKQLRDAIRLDAPKGADYGATPIFYLRVRDRDPERAGKLLEVLLDEFRKRYQELSAEQARHLYDATSRQVETSRRQLDEAADALDRFVAQLGVGLPELASLQGPQGGESDLRKSLSSVNQRLVPAQHELNERLALYEQAKKALENSGDPLVAPSTLAQQYPGLEQWARAYGEERRRMEIVAATKTPANPDHEASRERLGRVEQSYRDEITRALTAMAREIAAKETAVQSLVAQRDEYERRLATVLGRYVEYDGLKEEVRQRRAIVDDAEKRRSDAAHAQLTAAQEVLLSTVDLPRVSDQPVSPRRGVNVAVGTLLGLLCGIGLAFLAQQYSHTVRSEADLHGLGDDMVVVTLPRVRVPLEGMN